MAVTFKEFQTKAENVDAHPEAGGMPWTYAVTGLLGEAGRMSRMMECLDRGEALDTEERAQFLDHAWKSLWFLALLCREGGSSIEEAAERGMIALDEMGNEFIPPEQK